MYTANGFEFIYIFTLLACLNYAPGLNRHIIFNILDMTPQTIDLTELFPSKG